MFIQVHSKARSRIVPLKFLKQCVMCRPRRRETQIGVMRAWVTKLGASLLASICHPDHLSMDVGASLLVHRHDLVIGLDGHLAGQGCAPVGLQE